MERGNCVTLLKMLASTELSEKINLKRTIESCEQAIIKLMFPKKDRMKYDADLIKIRQEEIYRIEDYASQIRKIFDFYCFCSGLNPKEQETREEEYFFKGLHPRTTIELAKHGITTKAEAIAHIKLVEEVVLEKLHQPLATLERKHEATPGPNLEYNSGNQSTLKYLNGTAIVYILAKNVERLS